MSVTEKSGNQTSRKPSRPRCTYEPLTVSDLLNNIREERRELLRQSRDKYASANSKGPSRRRKERTPPKAGLILLGFSLAILLLGSWHNWSASSGVESPEQPPAEAQVALSISESQLREAERLIRGVFLPGDWRFKGARPTANMIHFYVQMPGPLKLESRYQENYIKQALCQRIDKRLWQIVKPAQVRFHLYSKRKASSISAVC